MSRERMDTSQLGPIRVDPTKTPVRAAFDRWWSEQSRRGDPARNPGLVDEAFAAGFVAGERHTAEHGPVRFVSGFFAVDDNAKGSRP